MPLVGSWQIKVKLFCFLNEEIQRRTQCFFLGFFLVL